MRYRDSRAPGKTVQVPPTIGIRVLTDLSGNYRDAVGPTGVACVRPAMQEFIAGKDMRVTVEAADFQNKPDIGSR